MFLAGMQKLSLLDYPGQLACTLFTLGCNLRCPWCHNAELVLPERAPEVLLDSGEVLAFLQKRQGVLDGVCISGGEPLLQAELPTLLRQIREIGYHIKLDTNGSFPERLRRLVEEKLVDYVAMDVKNAPARYAETVGIPNLDLGPIAETREYLLQEPVDYEFRTTVVRGLHTQESLLDAAKWIHGAKAWYLQQFRDSGTLIQAEGLAAWPDDEMQRLWQMLKEEVPAIRLRGVCSEESERKREHVQRSEARRTDRSF